MAYSSLGTSDKPEQQLVELLRSGRHFKGSAEPDRSNAELRPREEQLVIRLSAHSLGHIGVSGEAWSHATTYGNKLEFELELDES
jgi:hypothetical protein